VGDEEPRLVPTEAIRPPSVRFTAVAGGLDHTVALTGEPVTLAATTGDDQSTVVGAGFAIPLAVTVLDAGRLSPPVSGFTNGIGFYRAAAGNPVAGVPVTFEVTGGSASFTVAVPPDPAAQGGANATMPPSPAGLTSVVAFSDVAGVATAPQLVAGTTSGPVLVTATVAGVGQLTYQLTVGEPTAPPSGRSLRTTPTAAVWPAAVGLVAAFGLILAVLLFAATQLRRRNRP
jgi:hypothetical protein